MCDPTRHDAVLDGTMTPSWYVTRRVPLTIGVAAEALDTLARTPMPVVEPWDPLALDRIAAPVGSIVARRFAGTLAVSKLARAVPVEIELSAWSHEESALGLRPRTSRPPRRRAERYFPAAFDALESIEQRLTAVAAYRRRRALEPWLRAS
jgi:hypothetical protein